MSSKWLGNYRALWDFLKHCRGLKLFILIHFEQNGNFDFTKKTTVTDEIVEFFEISENIIEVKDKANMTTPQQKQYEVNC